MKKLHKDCNYAHEMLMGQRDEARNRVTHLEVENKKLLSQIEQMRLDLVAMWHEVVYWREERK